MIITVEAREESTGARYKVEMSASPTLVLFRVLDGPNEKTNLVFNSAEFKIAFQAVVMNAIDRKYE